MVTFADVSEVLGRWWFNYDEGNFDVLRTILSDDVQFTCRSSTGNCAYEEFIRADIRGLDEVMAWQTQHRLASPYPLRHNGSNVHIVDRSAGSATFSSYIFVTQMTNGMPATVPGGVVNGRVVESGDGFKIAELHVVLDTEDSVTLEEWNARR